MTSIGRARALLAVALVSLVAIGVAWAGRIAEGRRALAEADSALERGDVTEAILAARIAGEARCPGCTAPDEGFARLEKIARDAEARGDDATAFAAWRATRAALLATAVASTTSTRRAHADAEIARFAHRIDAAAVAAGATPTPAAAEDRVRAALNESDVPGAATFALIGLGGIVFLAAGARFATSKTKRSVTELGLALAGAAVA
ncbi:MAG: hypothetical protein QOI41_5216, partial [Myxococcales bacterium]|nr:hypothetical protein [Myxococcales bacterium]